MDRGLQEFERMYRIYSTQIYRYLLSIGCPPQDAEDLVQDTFVKALLRIDSFRGDCKLSVWLCQIAKNVWRDHLKKNKRKHLVMPVEVHACDSSLVEWLDLVEHLQEPYRRIFTGIVLEGRTYNELASSCGKSVSWARVTYYRARMKLQDMMTERRKDDAF